MRTVTVASLIVLVAVGAFATGMQEESPQPMDQPTIVEIAAEDGRFSTLVAALEAADLVDTLSGDGPFTVFAPTDDAFAQLPDGTVEGLLQDIPALTNVLTYHVVSGSVVAEDVMMLSSADTLQGQPVVVGSAEGVTINDATVTQADVTGSNGVIHVIDTVLLPPQGDIVDVAVAAGSFNTLTTALDAAGLVETLQGDGPFTVFAPTDAAFEKLPEGTVESLLADIPALTEVLTYHVSQGRVFSGDVVGLDEAPTVQGQTIMIGVDGGMVMLNDSASVVGTDVLATNGVIHIIDEVLLPN